MVSLGSVIMSYGAQSIFVIFPDGSHSCTLAMVAYWRRRPPSFMTRKTPVPLPSRHATEAPSAGGVAGVSSTAFFAVATFFFASSSFAWSASCCFCVSAVRTSRAFNFSLRSAARVLNSAIFFVNLALLLFTCL